MSMANVPLNKRFRLATSLRRSRRCRTTSRPDATTTATRSATIDLSGVTRNAGRGRAQVDLGLRLSWGVAFGGPAGAAGGAADSHHARRQRRSAWRHGRRRRPEQALHRRALRPVVQHAEPHERPNFSGVVTLAVLRPGRRRPRRRGGSRSGRGSPSRRPAGVAQAFRPAPEHRTFRLRASGASASLAELAREPCERRREGPLYTWIKFLGHGETRSQSPLRGISKSFARHERSLRAR